MKTTTGYPNIGLDETDCWRLFQGSAVEIIQLNLARHMGDMETFEMIRHQIAETSDLSGVPWNFQDEGHMHKLAVWLGIEAR